MRTPSTHPSLRPLRAGAAFLGLALLAAGCARREPPAPEPDPRIAALEGGLVPAQPAGWDEGLRLADRMRHYRVPAVAVAVLENGEIAWEKAWGLADREAGIEATTATLFQAGSISKPVNAAGILRLAEQGRVDLDQPVNDLLTSWQLPESELTAVTPVTLRHLLSHTGGTTVHGFPGYPSGFPLPTVVEILDGAPVANTPPVVVDLPPGEQERYSGGGTTISQLVVTDVTGQAYPDALRRLVLEPAGMLRSTYEQPLPAERLAEAAVGYRANGHRLPTDRHVYPEMAAAGLWTTPGDLVRFGAAIQASLAGAEAALLQPETAAQMVEPVRSRAGLGFFSDEIEGGPYFSHGGADEGFQAFLALDREGRYGAAIMTNSDQGYALAQEIVFGIARTHDWEGLVPAPVEPVTVPAEELARYEGRYSVRDDLLLEVELVDDRLQARVTLLPSTWLVPQGEGVFVAQDDGARIIFVADEDGKVIGYRRAEREGTELRPRLADDAAEPVELLEDGRIAEALAAYRPIALSSPARVNSTGYRFLMRGDPAAALALLELNAEINPGNANIWDSLADGYLYAGRLEEARGAFARVIETADGYPDPAIGAKLLYRARAELDGIGR